MQHNVMEVKSELSHFYGDAFYQKQMEGSYKSAQKYVSLLQTIFSPKSVADVGCGRGMWLKAFKEGGATTLRGFDGVWNNQANMIDQSIVFTSADLNKPFPQFAEKFDLSISLEVAEHLEASSAKTFVESLTQLSETVMFGAAFKDQGGTHHINEQLHSDWAKLFMDLNYIPYDVFRPAFWGDTYIDYWYRQNTFLYVKEGSSTHNILAKLGYVPIKNIGFMDCVHPDLFQEKLYYLGLESVTSVSLSVLLKQVIRRLLP